MYIDQNNDVTFSKLRDILGTYPSIKSTIKTAMVGEEYRNSLPSSSFADKMNRRYPLASKQDAILSKAYATKQANIAPGIMAEIDTALDIYSVDKSMFDSPINKIASHKDIEEEYLLEEQRKLPITAHTNIKVAEEVLFSNKRKLRPSTLNKASIKLVKEANRRGENVSTNTLKYAGLVQSDTEELSKWLEARASCTESEGIRSAFDKLATISKNIDSSIDRDSLIKLANTIEKLDSAAGLDAFYHRKLPDPISTVFNTKIAMQPMVELSGKQIPLATLLEIAPETYGDILGPDIVSEITKDGQLVPEELVSILETLPKDMKDSLVTNLDL